MSLTEPTTSHPFEDVTPLGEDARRAAESPTTWTYLRSLSGAPAADAPDWADDERLDELFSAWAKAALAADVVTDRGFTPVDEPAWTPPEPAARPQAPAPARSAASEPTAAYEPVGGYEPTAAYEPVSGYEPFGGYDPVAPYEPVSGYEPVAPYEPAGGYEPVGGYEPASPTGDGLGSSPAGPAPAPVWSRDDDEIIPQRRRRGFLRRRWS